MTQLVLLVVGLIRIPLDGIELEGTSTTLNGEMDEFRIYKRALTDNEAVALKEFDETDEEYEKNKFFSFAEGDGDEDNASLKSMVMT